MEDILGLGLLWWDNGLVIWAKSESFGLLEDVLGGENPLLNLLLQESISLFENIVVIAWFGLRFGCLEKVGSEDAFGIRFWILGCQTLWTREFVLVGLEIEKTVDSLFGELNRVYGTSVVFVIIITILNLGMGDSNSSPYGGVRCGITGRLCLQSRYFYYFVQVWNFKMSRAIACFWVMHQNFGKHEISLDL